MNINNLSKAPVEFRMSQIEVNQIVGENEFAMTVVTYEMLAQEEKNRQVAAAILTGLARWRECLWCVTRRVRKLHNARRTYRHVLQSDGSSHRSE